MHYKNGLAPRAPRHGLLSVAIAAVLLAPTAVLAQQTSTTPAQAEESAAGTQPKKLDTVTVVGSRIKRAQVEGPSPVTLMTSEQIQKEGFNTVHEALQTLSQNTGFGQNEFNAAGGFTPNASVINLRGMGPGRTLLLINGRRANDYPFPYNGRSNFQNFNNIPAGAVDRIEVLAGGASAIYGSDAVAGVVNVVLKKDFQGDQLKFKTSFATRGGREIADLQWVGGKTGEDWSLTYAFESYNAAALFAHQRDFMDSAQDNPAPPGTNGNTGLGGYQPPLGAQIRRQSSTGATLGYTTAGFNCAAIEGFRNWTYTSSATGATFGPSCGYDGSPAQQTVANGNRDLSAYLYGTYDLAGDTQAWASVMAYQSNSELGGGTEFWQGGPQPGAAYYDPQFGVRILPLRVLTPESYGGSDGTFQKFDERSYDLSLGLTGTFGESFDWDLSVGGARYKAHRERPRLTVQGAADFFLGTRLGTTTSTTAPGVAAGLPIYRTNLNRLFGPISEADYLSMSTRVIYDAVSENAGASFVVSGDLFELPAGPLGVAAVVEGSRQSYDLDSDRRLLPDVRSIYNLTGTGGGGERSRYATGLEFHVPIFSQLSLSLAGRYDKYDDVTDVDAAKTWGAGLEWRPFSSLLLRGNYATSFKAPDMHYVFAERSGSFGQIVDNLRCFREGVPTTGSSCSGAGSRYQYQAFTTSQGQRSLSEETGKSWTAGFVWDVYDNLSLSADYYAIDLENVVTVQSGASLLEAEFGCTTGRLPNGQPYSLANNADFCAASLSRITRDELGAITEIRSGPINLAFQGTKGIDATVAYRFPTTNYGNFRANLAWSHVLEQTSRSTPAAPLLQYRDLNSNADFRSRVRLSLGWDKDGWDATALMNRRGSFPIWNPAAITSMGLDSRIAPFITWNLSAGKKFTDTFAMRVNVNNVFDRIHPSDNTNFTYPYFFQAYDFIGRQIGVEATYKF